MDYKEALQKKIKMCYYSNGMNIYVVGTLLKRMDGDYCFYVNENSAIHIAKVNIKNFYFDEVE